MVPKHWLMLALLAVVLTHGCRQAPHPPDIDGDSPAGKPLHRDPSILLAAHPLPALSPGGQFLLGLSEGALQLFTLPDFHRQFSFDLGGAIPADTLWHPDGRSFALAVSAPDAVYHVVGDRLSRLADARHPLLGWSDNGKYLLLGQPLAVVCLDSGTTFTAPLAADIDVRHALFSPTATEVYFTGFDAAAGEDLWRWHWGDDRLERLTDSGNAYYPWAWRSETELLVHIGAIGTGGGHVTGFGIFDCTTDTVTIIEQDQTRGWRLLWFWHEKDTVLCWTVDAFGGGDKRLLARQLEGTAQTLRQGVAAVAAVDGPGDSVLLLLRADDGGWHVAQYLPRAGVLEISGHEQPLQLLGQAHDRVWYLEAMADGWLLRDAVLPQP